MRSAAFLGRLNNEKNHQLPGYADSSIPNEVKIFNEFDGILS